MTTTVRTQATATATGESNE
ncbi:uncharacterized protein G2W53_026161 [Senna tora]|uniref:Uncharacterized protein n=1 Tax=Senna tora TaxID=362788 RepID=A0A834TGF4_9FABA|nr:uncharacterized protein G2W53_026161 [Senna tora]